MLGRTGEQVMVLLKLVHNTKGKVIYPVQVRHTVNVELTQFADSTQQDPHEFLMAILQFCRMQLPRYQRSVSSVRQCKSCKYQSIRKEVFSCTEVPVPEIGIGSLENSLERWLAADEAQDWKCTSCNQRRSPRSPMSGH